MCKRTTGAIDSPNLVIRCNRLNGFCQLPTQLNKFNQYSNQTLFRLICSYFDILSVPTYLYNVLPVVGHRVWEVHQVVQVHWVVQSLGNWNIEHLKSYCSNRHASLHGPLWTGSFLSGQLASLSCKGYKTVFALPNSLKRLTERPVLIIQNLTSCGVIWTKPSEL